MNCDFCNQLLTVNDGCDGHWSVCLACNVSFQATYATDWTTTDIISMQTYINGRTYVLRQFLSLKASRVDIIPDDPEDTIIIACNFNFLLPSVTPTNIRDKLLTYLIFS